MNDSLHTGVVEQVPEPFTFLVRLDDGREVVAIPSRFHFEHAPDDLARVQALRPGASTLVRLSAANPAAGWLVRVAQTSEEWQRGEDPATLLETVRSTAGARELRLFACGCCRALGDLLPEGSHRELVGITEAYAEGRVGADAVMSATAADDAEEKAASAHAEAVEEDPRQGAEAAAAAKAIWAARIAARVSMDADMFEVALDAARCCAEAVGLRAKARALAARSERPEDAERMRTMAEATARAAQAPIVRELFGDPFRPAAR